jgi:hypothetical protein
MRENRGSRSHRWLFLLVPLGFMFVKHHHRRSMSEHGMAPGRLPPRIDATLKAWHDRAHEATQAEVSGAAGVAGVV